MGSTGSWAAGLSGLFSGVQQGLNIVNTADAIKSRRLDRAEEDALKTELEAINTADDAARAAEAEGEADLAGIAASVTANAVPSGPAGIQMPAQAAAGTVAKEGAKAGFKAHPVERDADYYLRKAAAYEKHGKDHYALLYQKYADDLIERTQLKGDELQKKIKEQTDAAHAGGMALLLDGADDRTVQDAVESWLGDGQGVKDFAVDREKGIIRYTTPGGSKVALSKSMFQKGSTAEEDRAGIARERLDFDREKEQTRQGERVQDQGRRRLNRNADRVRETITELEALRGKWEIEPKTTEENRFRQIQRIDEQIAASKKQLAQVEDAADRPGITPNAAGATPGAAGGPPVSEDPETIAASVVDENPELLARAKAGDEQARRELQDLIDQAVGQ